MGIELKNACLDGFQRVLEQILVHEETLESIVPDACPDIMSVIETVGEVFLKSREVVDGTLRLAGTIRTEILYIPDGEEGPRRLEVRLPFLCTAEDNRLRRDCLVMADPRLWELETRIINPRKVLVRARMTADVKVFQPRKLEVCTQAIGQPNQGLQQQVSDESVYLVTAVQEKSFTFNDVVPLPASKPTAEELLCSRVEPRTLDARIIGSKLILKGEATLNVLYRESGGEVCNVQFELPFSQVMEVSDGEESSDVWVWTILTSSGCTLQRGEPGELSVSLEFLAQAVVRSSRQLVVVSDLYCTACRMEAEQTQFPLPQLVDRGICRQDVRHFCSCSIPVRAVLEIYFTPGKMEWESKESGVNARFDARVFVLFRGEDGMLHSVAAAVPVNCELPAGQWSVRCLGASDLTAAPVSGGLEIRFQTEFSYLVTEERSCTAVSGVRFLPEAEEKEHLSPSLVLRVVEEGETLWNVAKSCGAAVADIMAANELEQERAPGGMLLLIPRRR